MAFRYVPSRASKLILQLKRTIKLIGHLFIKKECVLKHGGTRKSQIFKVIIRRSRLDASFRVCTHRATHLPLRPLRFFIGTPLLPSLAKPGVSNRERTEDANLINLALSSTSTSVVESRGSLSSRRSSAATTDVFGAHLFLV